MSKNVFISILLTGYFVIALNNAPDSQPILRGLAAPVSSRTPSGSEGVWRYTMTASVRPLLFWISRDEVGGGRIASVEEPDGDKKLELLIGSDPDRAPWQINRWGYIEEHISGTSSELVGIMTQSDEQSIKQAEMDVQTPGNRHVLKAIRSRLKERVAQSSTYLMHLEEDVTYKNVATILDLVPTTGSSIREIKVHPDTDPGFLYSVKEMIHESVDKYGRLGHLDSAKPKPRQYVYNASLFELSLVSSKLLKKEAINGFTYPKLIESRFEALNISTGKATSFKISYGTNAHISKIPVRIIYQPRWWFKAELRLINTEQTGKIGETG